MEMPEPGDVLLEKYRLDEVIGEGGFGIVYLGTTLQSGRPVAIKVLKPGSEGYDTKRAARFARELRTIAKLQNPHTLTMYDYGNTDDGLMLMVTEYVEGEDLGDLLKRRGTLTEYEVVHILLQVLESLREAHQIGVLHRDIKPANIRVFQYINDPLRVKVLDFGLAKSLGTGETKLTEAGKVVGTPRFMSPEQLRGKKLNEQTDIYSLGLVAMELLLGRRAGLIRSSKRRPELTIGDPVRRELRLVVNKMLAHRRRNRFESAAELITELTPMKRRLRQVAKAPPALVPRQAVALPLAEETEEDFVPATQVINKLGTTTEERVDEQLAQPRRRHNEPLRSLSMAVERLPVWVWVLAALVAFALVAGAIRIYQS